MPVFEFRCRACGQRFEDLLSWREVEEGKVRCPRCGSERVERLLSSFAVAGRQQSSGGAVCGPFC